MGLQLGIQRFPQDIVFESAGLGFKWEIFEIPKH
jgi:hypothetical protein